MRVASPPLDQFVPEAGEPGCCSEGPSWRDVPDCGHAGIPKGHLRLGPGRILVAQLLLEGLTIAE